MFAKNVIILLSLVIIYDSPKNGHSCFHNKWIAQIRTCNIIDLGIFVVPKTGIHFFWKHVLPFSGHATEDFRPKRPKIAKFFMRQSQKQGFLFQE
jgi:hypothetical protein